MKWAFGFSLVCAVFFELFGYGASGGISGSWSTTGNVVSTNGVNTAQDTGMTYSASLIPNTFVVHDSLGNFSIPSGSLPLPTASAIGGVYSYASVSHQWINGLLTNGHFTGSQPSYLDISGTIASVALPGLTGDVTSSAGSNVTTVAKIQGTVVTGTTGTGNVVFSTGATMASVSVVGLSDAYQLNLKGFTGQINPVFGIQSSTGVPLFSTDNTGNTYNAGVLRVGTNSAILENEQASVLLSTSSASTTNDALNAENIIDTASATTGFINRAINAKTIRRNSAASSTSESAQVQAIESRVTIDYPNAQTYTNTSTNGVSNIRIVGTDKTNAGSTLAITNAQGIYLSADSVATGTYKTGIRFAGISGATNNALISDNVAHGQSAGGIQFSGTYTNNLGLGTTTVAALTSSGLGTLASVIASDLTASQAVFSDGNKHLVSNTVTGTNNVVRSTGATMASVSVVGLSDAYQLNLTGFSSQTNPIFAVQSSTGVPLFSTGNTGNTYNAGPLKVGTNSTLISAGEQVSILNALTAVPSTVPNALTAQTTLTSNSASTTAQLRALDVQSVRTVTANVTDTQSWVNANYRATINVDTGHTYTNSGASGIVALNIQNASLAGGGAVTSTYSGIGYNADSTAFTGYKTGIRFQAFSGGTTGNALIADNITHAQAAGGIQFSGTYTNNLGAGTTTVGNLADSGTFTAPNLATSSAATTGTLCWTTGTGNVNVDTTLACLASTRKIKENIKPLNIGLNEIMKLKPISYNLKKEYNPEKLGTMVGLIAEDVEKIDNRLVSKNKKGEALGVRYMQFTAVLTKAIQEQQEEIRTLRKEIKVLQKELGN